MENSISIIVGDDLPMITAAMRGAIDLAFTGLPPARVQHIREIVFGIVEGLKFSSVLVRDGCDNSLPASAANDLRVLIVPELTDIQRSFMSALGARDIEACIQHSARLLEL